MIKAALQLLILSALLLTGCAYTRARAHDAIDMGDLGLTFTRTAQFSAYINCPTVIPVGWGRVSGTFVGIADGKFGIMRHKRQESGFLLYGQEHMTFGDDTAPTEDVGLLGLATRTRTAKKRPMCVHHLHLGYVGAIWNIRWWEIPDFILGFVGIDYQHDDMRAQTPAIAP